MLSEKSLNIIYNSMSKRAKETLQLISEFNMINAKEIQNQMNYSYTKTRETILELEHKLLAEKGDRVNKTIPIYLTENGEWLLEKQQREEYDE